MASSVALVSGGIVFSSSSKLYIASQDVVLSTLLQVVLEKSGCMSDYSRVVACAVFFPFLTIYVSAVFFENFLKFRQMEKTG